MVRKEDVDFYRSFSRKELQSLCKKYGLPANRSSSDMAESLASYFEKSSLNSMYLGMELGRVQEASVAASLVPSMQLGPPLNATGNVRKDCCGPRLMTIEENYPQTTTFRNSDCSMGANKDFQEAFDDLNGSPFVPLSNSRSFNNDTTVCRSDYFCLGRDDVLANRTQFQKRKVKVGAFPHESASVGDSTVSPTSSFEFFVGSEEGVSLCVDLNFNPSNWINKLKSEVSVCDNMHHKKSRVSDQGTDCFTESNKQTRSQQNQDNLQGKDGHVHKEFSAIPVVKENGHVLSDYPSCGEGSLASSAVEPCGRVIDTSGHCREDEGLNLPVPNSTATGQIGSCTESCCKSCCIISVDLDCVSSPRQKMASDSVVVIPDGPMNPEKQNLLVDKLPNEINENLLPESPHKVGNSSTGTPTGPGGGSEISSSDVEVYKTNELCSPCKTGKSQDSFDPKLFIDTEPLGHTITTELQGAGRGCLLSYVEEQENSEIISGRGI